MAIIRERNKSLVMSAPTTASNQLNTPQKRLGDLIFNSLGDGLFRLKKIIHDMGVVPNENDIRILMPDYLNNYLIYNITQQGCSKQGNELRFRGCKITAGYEQKMIVLYHKDFSFMGIEPVKIQLDIDIQTP